MEGCKLKIKRNEATWWYDKLLDQVSLLIESWEKEGSLANNNNFDIKIVMGNFN